LIKIKKQLGSKKDFMNLKQVVDNINNLEELGEGCTH